MKALVLEKAYTLCLREKEIPTLQPNWALLKVEAACVCGSDIHAYRGNSLLLTYPRVLGHELCATVKEISGDSKDIKVGDRVCVMPYLSCGECFACKQHRENCCSSLRVMGVHIEGGMSEYVAAPIACLLKVPQHMNKALVALMEPLSVSAHAVRRGNIGPQDQVLVVGAGPIGLGAAEMARISGADVRIADTSLLRRDFAREQFNYQPLDPLDEHFMEQLLTWTNGTLPNKIIDSTGNQKSMAGVVNYLSNAGCIIFVGLQSGTLDVSDPEFHKREATIYASRVAQKEDFERVLKYLEDQSIAAEKMITHVTDLSHAAEEIPQWINQGAAVFKGLVTIESGD